MLFLFSTWENRSPVAMPCPLSHNLSIGRVSLLQWARWKGEEKPFRGAQRHLVSRVKMAVGIQWGPESLLQREEWLLGGGGWERGGCSHKTDTGTPHMTSQGDPPPQFLPPLTESSRISAELGNLPCTCQDLGQVPSL